MMKEKHRKHESDQKHSQKLEIPIKTENDRSRSPQEKYSKHLIKRKHEDVNEKKVVCKKKLKAYKAKYESVDQKINEEHKHKYESVDQKINEEHKHKYESVDRKLKDEYISDSEVHKFKKEITKKVKKEPISDDESVKQSFSKHRRDHSNERRNQHRKEDDRNNDMQPPRSRWEDDRAESNQFHRRHRYRDNYDRQDRNRERNRDRPEYARNDTGHEWGRREDNDKDKKKPLVNNAKPDFSLSGKLTEETNTFNGVVIKYSEPPEARKPKRRWRLYPFKGEESLPVLHLHRQSAYLIGRDRKIADIPVDHPSCSKQHAVFQYRLTPYTREDGLKGKRVRPYIIDLESANGTYVNSNRIEAKKYVELLERDVIKFGFSSREYVLLHEHSKDSDEDDNVNDEGINIDGKL